jgi:hypothetical protein
VRVFRGVLSCHLFDEVSLPNRQDSCRLGGMIDGLTRVLLMTYSLYLSAFDVLWEDVTKMVLIATKARTHMVKLRRYCVLAPSPARIAQVCLNGQLLVFLWAPRSRMNKRLLFVEFREDACTFCSSCGRNKALQVVYGLWSRAVTLECLGMAQRSGHPYFFESEGFDSPWLPFAFFVLVLMLWHNASPLR